MTIFIIAVIFGIAAMGWGSELVMHGKEWQGAAVVTTAILIIAAGFITMFGPPPPSNGDQS